MQHTITLTNEQINLVAAGLAELPYKLAQPLLALIQQQIMGAAKAAEQQQVQPAPESPAAEG